MPRYHVHVYRVIGMEEFDMDAPDEVKARTMALDAALSKHGDDIQIQPMKESDCRWVAMSWPSKERDSV